MSGELFMGKIGQKLRDIFTGKQKKETQALFDDICDTLITGDVLSSVAQEISDELKTRCKEKRVDTTSLDAVTKELEELLIESVKSSTLEFDPNKKNIWLLLGVNGAGKTTTCAKLAKIMQKSTSNIVMAAADTFRAAAIEQLQEHSKKVGVKCVAHKINSDPASVIFDAADECFVAGGGLVLADTAGRLHNKENLMQELAKLDRTCVKKAGDSGVKRILVIDCTSGGNAFRQACAFGELLKIDGIILTKYDSTARGGVAINIARKLRLGVNFVCDGEGYGDIKEFDCKGYVNDFVYG